MMKLNKFSLAFIAFLAPFSVKAATLYDENNVSFDMFGLVNVNLANDSALYQEGYNNKASDNSLFAESKLGIATRYKIAKNFDAIAMGQWNFSSDDSENEKCDYLYVGVDAYFYGTLIMGRGDSAYYTVAGVTDIFDYLDTNFNDYYAHGDQRSSQFMYSISALGFDLRMSYQTSNEFDNDLPFAIRNAGAIAVSTNINEKIRWNYGIDYYDYTYENKTASSAMEDYFAIAIAKDRNLSDVDAKNFAKANHVGHKYNMGTSLTYGVLDKDLYMALSYGVTDYDVLLHHIQSLEYVLSYSFDSGFDVRFGIGTKLYGSDALFSSTLFALAYRVNPNFKVYAETSIDIGGDASRLYEDKVASYLNENKYVLGATYFF